MSSKPAIPGSSPLTRGKRQHHHQSPRDRGLIPAHAGKTSRRRGRREPLGAHPRSRGENWAASTGFGRAAGSSPLTRGKRREFFYATPAEGLIPAHAGKTSLQARGPGTGRAHPRSRGENILYPSPNASSNGSSPLTRGKPTVTRLTVGSRGLIPAHAGKTRCGRGRRWRRPAHPRSRGENRPQEDEHQRLRGLIPAHAGKTTSSNRAPRS